MRRLLVLSIVGLLGVVVAAYVVTEGVMSTRYVLPDVHLLQPQGGGAAVVARLGCARCHGPALSGRVVTDGWARGQIIAPNLTPGDNSVTRAFSDADWARAIRYALGRDGRALVAMPATRCSDQDLTDAIAHLNQLEPKAGEAPRVRPGPLTRLEHLLGDTPLTAPEAAALRRQGL